MKATNPIRISGVTGVNANSINGVYEPLDEMSNGACLYRKMGDPDKWIEYGADGKKEWVVKKIADKGFARGWATLQDPPAPLENSKVGAWLVYDGAKFANQKDMKITIAGYHSLRISGATGSNAASVNGVYNPTDEISNGVTVYQKAGDPNKWLEYTPLKWMVKPTKDRGTSYGWCILDVDQVCIPEKFTEKPLRVFDGTNFLPQPECKLSVTSTQPLRISGATGINASTINGVYEPMEEAVRGVCLFRKVGDHEKWLEFGAENKKEWVVKKSADKGFARGWATLFVGSVMLPDRAKEGEWKIYDGTNFVNQKDVKTSIAATNSIRITGASGSNANSVNGLYEPTEEVSHGISVYRKVGDSAKWLEYTALKWMVKPTKDKGAAYGWGILDVDRAVLPEKAGSAKSFRVFDGTTFVEQKECKVSIAGVQPVRITEATGMNGVSVNGVYTPTEEVANGITVYRKVGDSDKWLEYGAGGKNEWVVKKTSDKGHARGWASLFVDQLTVPEKSYREGGAFAWQVYDGTKFTEQKEIRLSIAGLNNVIISGATGTNASSVNGVYVPTKEVSNGVTIYRKVGDSAKWLEYTVLKWMVKPTKDKGNPYGWCILDVDQVILPEKCVGKPLRVYDGTNFLEQKDCKVSIMGSHPIRIFGATGLNSTTVNGIYEPTTEVSNGICVYRKAGDLDKWLEYGGGGKTEWVIKKTADKGHGRGWAALHIDSLMVPEQAGDKGGGVGWQVYDGTKFENQKDVRVAIAGVNSVRIAGATGTNATHVNGVYEPTEEICNGITVYRKIGDGNKWLEYTELKWMVKPTKDKGSPFGWCLIDVDQVILPEHCTDKTLRLYDGTNFNEQKTCRISLAGVQPVRVAGATGTNAATINGVYEPTTEVSNGITVYRKVGDSDKWLEYGAGGKNEWVVKKTSDKGHARGWASLFVDQLTVPEKCGKEGASWQVYDGTKFNSQTTVTITIAGIKAVRIAGATGSNAASVNGVYEPTEEISNGVTVYRKIGDANKWLEYTPLKWMVKPTKDKGNAYGWCIVDVDHPMVPERCRGRRIRIYDGTEFVEQNTTSISLLEEEEKESALIYYSTPAVRTSTRLLSARSSSEMMTTSAFSSPPVAVVASDKSPTPSVSLTKDDERTIFADSLGLSVMHAAVNVSLQIEILDAQLTNATVNDDIPASSIKFWNEEKTILVEKRDSLQLNNYLPKDYHLLNGLTDRLRYFYTSSKAVAGKTDDFNAEKHKLQEMEKSLKENENPYYDIYLSFDWHAKDRHGRNMRDHILSMRKFLTARGLKTFCYENHHFFENMTTASANTKKIHTAIKNSKCVLMFLTHSYRSNINAVTPSDGNESGNHYEYQTTMKELSEKRVLPLLLDSTIKSSKEWKTEVFQATIGNPNFMMNLSFEEHEEDEVMLTGKFEALITRIMKIIIENA
jgi:hypothetical protein